ncbi:MAG: LysM peptidoglycan-binding domain-containing protein [Pirellulales bacterium]
MNSIRPLITITILVVVGAFLYVKINEGPVRSSPNSSNEWPNQSPEGVPSLAATSSSAPPSTNPAPPWPASPAAATLSSDTVANTTSETAQQPPPAIPPIPALPEVAPSVQPTAPITSSVPPLPTELPANIPTARYPDQPAPTATVANETAANTALPAAAVAGPAPDVPPVAATQEAAAPAQANIGIAASNLESPPSTTQQPPLTQQNPLRQSPGAEGERYDLGANPAAAVNVQTPPSGAQTSFAASWPTIKASLDRGELSRAHELLSQWYDDPSLTPTDAELVDSLLSQLAGTVVYSTEHQLEPAYVAKPGDTLETIAKECNVPWQLLAKINGIAAADQVRPGQELKVVRGPFSAVVDLGRKQLTLMVGDRYAGKFPITVPSSAAVSEGQWLVDQKTVVPPASVAQSAYTPVPAVVDRAIVLRGEPSAGQAAIGTTLTIASGSSSNSNAGSPAIRISPQDAEELSDILSIGSRVVIRR